VTARSVWRTVTDAFKAEFGKPDKRRNPWPKCRCCLRRFEPPACLSCARCPGCCEKCDDCGRCVLRCPGHKESDQ
jgi:hypothetical protein